MSLPHMLCALGSLYKCTPGWILMQVIIIMIFMHTVPLNVYFLLVPRVQVWSLGA